MERAIRSETVPIAGCPASRPVCTRLPGAAGSGGFTLVEMLIVLLILGIVAAIGYPSYVDYIVRGYRSEGQQWLLDFAQRQEQIFLDRRGYATGGLGTGANQVPMAFPDPSTTIDQRYNAPVITPVAGPPAGYIACLQPRAGGPLAARNDGGLCVDATGLRWRDINGNGAFDAGTDVSWTTR